MTRGARALLAGSLALVVLLPACRGDEDEQVAELEQQVSDLEADVDAAQTALAESLDTNAQLEEDLIDAQDQLAGAQSRASSAEDELAATQAALSDAEAQLAQVGELRLDNGTYVGPVLGAKSSPYPIIVFNAGGLFRVALVTDDPTITAGGDDFTLAQFGKLLASTDADDVKLANGNYKVIVKNGVVTSIRKSSA